MKIAFIADGRSPTTVGWITPLVDAGHEIHVISSYPCDRSLLPGVSVYDVPLALSRATAGGSSAIAVLGRRGGLRRAVLGHVRAQDAWMAARGLIGPVVIKRQAARVRAVVERIQPDLVHALRIPFEGMAASIAVPDGVKFIVSIWGNDLTLHAALNPLMSSATRKTLRRADGLIADTQRDVRLAHTWGLAREKPTLVTPGGGGVDRTIFHPGKPDVEVLGRYGIRLSGPIVINPRGFRPLSLRQDCFFAALPRFCAEVPDAQVVCVAMAGNHFAEQAVRAAGLDDKVRLLPGVPHAAMGEMFRAAQVTVAPSIHDGTPNSLLEAMACGVFPVGGDIESAREWIVNGVNGLLVDATDPDAIAMAMRRPLVDHDLIRSARAENERIVDERADRQRVRERVLDYYDAL